MEEALADAFKVYMGLEVSTPYRCFDYLSTSPDHSSPPDAYTNEYMDHIFSSLLSDPSAGPMTEVWRERICEWCFQVSIIAILFLHFECKRNNASLV